ncbi:hypothetical protein ACHWQZ_G019466 [Mnemiopsis leidyi]
MVEENGKQDETASETSKKKAPAVSSEKIAVVLRNVGNAPILQKQKYNVDKNKTVKWMSNWIKGKLKLQENEQVILYIAQQFAPPIDQHVGNLFDCFGTNDKLVVQYATQPAWG